MTEEGSGFVGREGEGRQKEALVLCVYSCCALIGWML